MNVYFVGGSITEGAGSSEDEYSYVSKVSSYIKEKYINDNVNVFNLGAGGTASNFAVFRIAQAFEKNIPDVVFIEFAVNDRIYPASDIGIYYENLILKIRKWNSSARIISLEMPTGMADACSSVHKKYAYYHDVSVIDVQDKVYKDIGREMYKWKDISIDNLHPNDRGHELYAEYIIDELANIKLDNKPCYKNKMPIERYRFKNPEIISYENCSFYGGWSEKIVNMKNKFDIGAFSSYIGDCIEFDFTGKFISIMCVLSRNSGILEYTIDNKFNFLLDLYMDSEQYFSTLINIRDLDKGSHTLIMKVSSKKNEKSNGNEILIGGFLVDQKTI